MTDARQDPYAPPPPSAPQQPYAQQPYAQQPYPQPPYPQYGPPAPRRSTGRLVAVVIGAVVLVVALVLGGLALLGARALETQQDRGDERAVRTALRNALIAQETYAIERDGSYTTSLADLVETGVFEPDPAVEIVIVRADTSPGGEDRYCLAGRHVDGGPTIWLAPNPGVGSTESTEPCE